MNAATTVLDIDPFTDDVLSAPFPGLHAIREAASVVRLSRYDIWATGRYDEVFAARVDPMAQAPVLSKAIMV